MKRVTTNLMLTAAALLAVAGSASAQALKAEIPFAFQAGGAALPAGSYRVEAIWSTGAPIVRLYNGDRNHSAALLGYPMSTAGTSKRDARPVLTFKCVGARCELASVSGGYGSVAVRLPAARMPRSERADVRTVTLALKAD